VNAGVVNSHDAGVVQRGGGTGLLFEPPHHVLVGGKRERQELDCNRPPELGIASSEDAAHCALADERVDLVPPDAGRDGAAGQSLILRHTLG
jgi:hypothetical protein